LIELLLFFSVPRVNTNDIAHRLLDRFGSLELLFQASIDQLTTVEGVGTSSAIIISLIGILMRRSKKSSLSKRKKYSSLEEIGNLLTELFRGLQNERFLALYFDASMRLIEISTVSEGSIGEAAVSPSRITREAVLKGASSVIIAHNHPLGAASLSSSDRNLTHVIEASLAAVDIPLIEHIVVGEVGYAPTMVYKASPVRSALSTKIYGSSFYKEFYKN
jgi:DNA repair protein RadC